MVYLIYHPIVNPSHILEAEEINFQISFEIKSIRFDLDLAEKLLQMLVFIDLGLDHLRDLCAEYVIHHH